MNIQILFQDENILVINKPSGLVVHPFDNSHEETLLDILQNSNPEIFSLQDNTFTLQNGTIINLGGIVHKLDRETSGVMVIAKNQTTKDVLRKLFREHTVQKQYVALVEGVIQPSALRIDAPLGRNKKDYKQVAYPENPRGELREAITDARVLFRGHDVTLVQLEPLTGRTHQLRAHMNYLHHPIVGDIAYGSTTPSPRIMLHAHKLRFILENKELTFEAPVPETFIAPFE